MRPGRLHRPDSLVPRCPLGSVTDAGLVLSREVPRTSGAFPSGAFPSGGPCAQPVTVPPGAVERGEPRREAGRRASAKNTAVCCRCLSSRPCGTLSVEIDLVDVVRTQVRLAGGSSLEV